jgi:PAS domain S-box-containing protein
VKGLQKGGVAERRANIIGWVYAPFRMNDLMLGIHGEHAADLDIEIFDGKEATDAALLYDSNESRVAGPPRVASLESSSVIEIAAHAWTINVRALPSISERVDGNRPAVIAIAGIVISILLAWLTWLLLAAHERTIVVVQKMKRYIAEHKRMEETLQESEARLKIIMAAAQDAILMMSAGGQITFFNPAAERIFGWSAEEAVGKDLHGLLVPEKYLDAYTRGIERFRHSREGAAVGKTLELTALRKDGCEFPIEVSFSSMQSGGDWHGVGIVRDTTERKRVEDALRASEERYRFLVEQVPAIIYTAAPDESSSTLFTNSYIEKVFGFSSAEYTADPEIWHRHLHPDDREGVLAALDRTHKEQVPFVAEYRMFRRDGSIVWIHDEANMSFDSEGKRLFVQGVMIDISARKNAEEALRKSEERLRDILFSMADWVWEVDEHGVYTYSSQKAGDLLGRSSEDVAGKTPFDFMPPEEAKRVAAIFSEAAANKAPIRDLENWNIAKNGTRVCLLTSGVPILDEKRNLIGYRGVDKDVTGPKRIEEELKLRNVLLSTQQEATIDGILMVDENGRIILFNRRFVDMMGIPADLVAAGADDPVLKLVVEKMLQPEQFLEKVMYLYEHRDQTSRDEIALKDGRTFDRYSAPMCGEAGRYYGRVWYFRDITELKQMQEALRESEQFLHASIDALSSHIVILDESARIVFANKAWRAFAADNAIDPLRVSEGADYLLACDGSTGADAEVAQRFAQAIRSILAGNDTPFEMEYPCHSPDEKRWFIGRVTAFLASDAARVAIAHENITVRKLTEESLRQSEERYRALFSSSQDAIMTLEPPLWRFTSGNPTCIAMFAAKDQEEFASHGPWDVSPERQPGGRSSAEAAREMIETAMREGSSFFEWRHKRLDGKEFPATVLFTRLEIGDHAFLQATVRDISRQKHLEIELNQAQKLEAVGRLAAGIAHEINTPTQYVGDNIEFLQTAYGGLLDLARTLPSVIAAGREGPIPAPLLSQVDGLVENANIAYIEEQIPRAIEQSLEGVGRIATIVQAMKEFSHPGVSEKTPVDLNQCIRSTVTVSRNEWKYAADVELHLDDNLPPVCCLPGEFNQAVLNMIVNATHSIADVVGDGGVRKGTIAISTRQDGPWAEVRISDTGAGIPEDIRVRIFDPFFTTKEVGRGTGQGLAISRNVIVDKHRGTINVESEVGKGSTFIIRLPIEGVDPACGPPPVVCTVSKKVAGIQ